MASSSSLELVAAKIKEAYDLIQPLLPPDDTGSSGGSSSCISTAADAAPTTHSCHWCTEGEIKPDVLKLRDWEVSAEQLTPEWYAARKDRVTASEMPDILCRGRTSRIERLRKKCGLSNKEMSAFGKQCCDHGRQHEDGAIKLFEEHTGHRVLPFGLLVNPDRPWLGASPDGITYCGICIEAKCPYNRTIRPGEVPAHYMDQVQTQLFVSQLKKAAFVQWGTQDNTFDITYVDPDEDWFIDNVGKIVSFYEQMLEVRKDKSKIVKYERRSTKRSANNSSDSSGSGSGSSFTSRVQRWKADTNFNFILDDEEEE